MKASNTKASTTYPAAQLVAKSVEEHFSRHQAAARLQGEMQLAPLPDATIIESLLSTAFWASLRREEGHSPKISLAYLPSEQAAQALLLEQPLEFSTESLIKLSPGVERAGIHLGVWHKNERLFIWGTTRTIPSICMVVDVSEPGLLVIKHRRPAGFGKFANVAILQGDQVKVVDETVSHQPSCPTLLSSLLETRTSTFWQDSLNVLVQLAVSMRAHGRGGILLIVPHASTTWQQSIIYPLSYAITSSLSGLALLVNQRTEQQHEALWQSELRREIDGLAGLTAIDGATIISDQYHLLAFGTKISRASGKKPVDKLLITEPIVGVSARYVHPSKSGGTRHLSAAQFVHDQPDALALVASQDGRFTIFSWADSEQTVQAHRIESLLL